jgi:hypothetical protein
MAQLLVHLQLTPYMDANKQSEQDACPQSEYVEGGIKPVSADVPIGEFEVILQHGLFLFKIGNQRKHFSD